MSLGTVGQVPFGLEHLLAKLDCVGLAAVGQKVKVGCVVHQFNAFCTGVWTGAGTQNIVMARSYCKEECFIAAKVMFPLRCLVLNIF